MSRETRKMAKMTRRQAEAETPDQRTPEGSHDFPSDAQDDGFEHPVQQGVGQTDDITGKAPASGMARQKSHPARP